MSKFFYKGKIEKKPKYESFGFNTKRTIKPGTVEKPLQLSLQSEARQQEIETLLAQHQLVAEITLDPAAEENIQELMVLLNKPKTTTFAQVPKRNEPCHCGSGKKYKKCCG